MDFLFWMSEVSMFKILDWWWMWCEYCFVVVNDDLNMIGCELC